MSNRQCGAEFNFDKLKINVAVPLALTQMVILVRSRGEIRYSFGPVADLFVSAIITVKNENIFNFLW